MRVAPIAAFLVLVAFLFMNLDGYQTHLFSPWGGMGAFRDEPPIIMWCHGWPGSFLIRRSCYSVKNGKGTFGNGRFAEYSRWPIDNAPIAEFSAQTLAVNVLIIVSLVFGTAYGLKGCEIPKFRFTTKSLLVLTSIVAVAVTLKPWTVPPRYWLQVLAFAIIVVAALITIGSVLFPTYRFFATRNPNG